MLLDESAVAQPGIPGLLSGRKYWRDAYADTRVSFNLRFEEAMKTFVLLIVMLTCAGACAAQTTTKCFRAEWLQGERSVNLTINGSKVSGTFTASSGDDPDRKTHSFSGTRPGNVLTVVFDENERPDVSPSELKGPGLHSGPKGQPGTTADQGLWQKLQHEQIGRSLRLI